MRLQLALMCLMAQVIYTKPVPQADSGATGVDIDAPVNVNVRSEAAPADAVERQGAPLHLLPWKDVPAAIGSDIRPRDVPIVGSMVDSVLKSVPVDHILKDPAVAQAASGAVSQAAPPAAPAAEPVGAAPAPEAAAAPAVEAAAPVAEAPAAGR